MDILIFLGTLAAVLVGGFFVIKLMLGKKNSGRNAKHYSAPLDSRLKQRHTGRPHLRHQTAARVDYSEEIWRASRIKDKEASWQNGSFTAARILTDEEKKQDMLKQHEGLAMPTIDYVPTEEPVRRSASAGVGGARAANRGRPER